MDKPRVVKREKLYKVGDFIDSVLGELRGSLKEDMGDSLEEVRAAWSIVAGKAIVDNCSIVSLKGGVLVVSVKKSVWRSELEFLKVGIIEKINKYMGKELLRNIILR